MSRDKDIVFPEFVLLKASAGTGKTHALTLRFTQFLLSEKIKNNDLRQILAITFTRNAAKEMKTRILEWLKDCYFGQEATTSQILELVSVDRQDLASRAQATLENLLTRYSDFQVMTIDSFMAEVFRASSLDLGVSPDFEITLDKTPVIVYAFSRFLRRVAPNTPEGQLMCDITDHLQSLARGDASFIWDPTREILEKFIELYHKLESLNRRPRLEDNREKIKALQPKIRSLAEEINDLIASSPLRPHSRSAFFSKILPAIRGNSNADLLVASLKTPPVIKPASPRPQEIGVYEVITQKWENLRGLINEFKEIYARSFFYPYLLVYDELVSLVAEVKRERALVFLEDINQKLASYLQEGIVPDVYFRLGERIYHYLIDEFQDTSPRQWDNLKPLIENSLAQGGSLFVVGDTKQAIYGFREADYEIMMNLERGLESFPSTETRVRELTINWRSKKEILDFVQKIFPHGIRALAGDKNCRQYSEAAARSGLDDFLTSVPENSEPDSVPRPGYVEVEFFAPAKEEREVEELAGENTFSSNAEGDDQLTKVKNKVHGLIQELRERGYRYSDIAILTYKNDSVVQIAAWLNEKKIPFLPFSSLDIRLRKVIQEIFALLRFLDFPPDNLSLAAFLLGDIFARKLKRDLSELTQESWREFIFNAAQKKDSPFYTAFRRDYPEVWEKYFEPFFKTVGYYPLYDLVTQVYRTFAVFELFPEEEASLVKLLEVIKEFEGMGKNNLRDFLFFSEEVSADESIWAIDVAAEIEAIKIMTIHKAKGLGFPVVILLLFPERFISPTFYLDKSPEEGGAYVLKLSKEIADASPWLNKIYEEYRTKELVNRLNTFYVALTRAREELYVIGIKEKRKSYPFDILEKLGITTDPAFFPSPQKPPVPERKKKPDMAELKTKKLELPVLFPAAERRAPLHAEIKRGELIHTLLAGIDYLRDGPEETLRQAALRLGIDELSVEFQEIKATILRFLKDASFAGYFQPWPGRKVFCELELANSRGELFRADRVIVDPEEITVIDYKTGGESSQEIKETYRRQVRNYQQILRDVYPEKKIQGILIYLDENSWEKVE